MDKNQAKQSFANYISFHTQAKEELAEIKKISNLKEQREKTEASFEKHSRNLLHAQGLLNSYNISGEVNMSDFWVYSSTVSKLKEIKDKYNKEEKNKSGSNNFNSIYCSECKNSIIGQYFQKDDKKFCSRYCLDNYYVCDKCQQKLTGEYYISGSNRNTNKRGLTCITCYQGFCSECCQPNSENCYYNKVKADNKKFCSEKCFINHYEKQLTQEKKDKKIQEQEKILAELKKASEERKKMVDDFQEGLNDYVENQKNNDNSNSISISNNNNLIERERERERERESKILLNNNNYSLKLPP